jgi:hypothetical protein
LNISSQAHYLHYRSDSIIKLNFEELKSLDELLVASFDRWVHDAPEHWKADRFLLDNAPLVVTSCFGQNVEIAVPGNEAQEALNWYGERDYNKIAFLTVALATSIKYVRLSLKFLFSYSIRSFVSAGAPG